MKLAVEVKATYHVKNKIYEENETNKQLIRTFYINEIKDT